MQNLLELIILIHSWNYKQNIW